MMLTHWFLSLANHLCLTLYSWLCFLMWLLSIATPLRATVMETTAGDRRLVKSSSTSPSFTLQCALLVERCMCCCPRLSLPLFLSLFGFAMYQIILMQQKLWKYHTLVQRGWFRWWDHLILQLRDTNPKLERERKWQWGHVCEFHTVSWIVHFH